VVRAPLAAHTGRRDRYDILARVAPNTSSARWARPVDTRSRLVRQEGLPRQRAGYAWRREDVPEGSPPVTVRLAEPKDYEAVARLNAEVQQLHADALPHLFRPASDRAFTRAVYDGMLAQPRCHLYVALAGTEAVGYVYAEVQERPEAWFRYAHRVVYIHHLSVGRRHRRKGYGERLLQQVVALARSQGVGRLELDTWWFNADARAFFRRFGFTDLNLRMGRDLS
jgi:ribosomal protein S18 acetylase RimI-like enzyme